jgi:hypothetical protein
VCAMGSTLTDVGELVCANALKLKVIPAVIANKVFVFKVTPWHTYRVLYRSSVGALGFLFCFLGSYANAGQRVKEPEYIQQPKNDGDNYDAI